MVLYKNCKTSLRTPGLVSISHSPVICSVSGAVRIISPMVFSEVLEPMMLKAVRRSIDQGFVVFQVRAGR